MTGYGSVLKQKDMLRGITPTIETFDNVATAGNLDKSTNNNPNDSTDELNKVITGAFQTIGVIKFDTGSINKLDVAIRASAWSTAGAIQFYLDSCESEPDTATNWRNGAIILLSSNNQTSESQAIRESIVQNVYGRYLRFRILGNAAMTGRVKVYGVSALKVD